MSRGAVFFDRDGVLNKDVAYAHRRDQIEWTPGAAEAVRLANAVGRLVFVVTNQSGVARGLFDEAAVQALHRWMGDELAAQGARIDGWRYCPHHPDGVVPAYARESEDRKPAPGMILSLMAEHDVDPARSFLIGDMERDVQAAEAAGMPGLLFDGGDLPALVARGLALSHSVRITSASASAAAS